MRKIHKILLAGLVSILTVNAPARPDISGKSGGFTSTAFANKTAAYGQVSPRDFGADVSDGIDDTDAVQAAIDAVKASWDAKAFQFQRVMDCDGESFEVSESLDFSGIRQPGFVLSNCGFISSAQNQIALDFSLTNAPNIINVNVRGASENPPAVGIYLGRAKFRGHFPASASAFLQNVDIAGAFSMAGILNFASEVSRLDAVEIRNTSDDIRAVGLAMVATSQAIIDQFGRPLRSRFQNLPNRAERRQSCIIHTIDGGQIGTAYRHISPVVALETYGNSVVVVMEPDAGKDLKNGDKIFFSFGNAHTLRDRVFTVANRQGNRFTLSEARPRDAIGYTRGGLISYKTGSAVFVSGCNQITMGATYLLSFGSPTIVFDLDNGGASTNMDMAFSAERSPPSVIRLLAKRNHILTHWSIKSANYAQKNDEAFIEIKGPGTIRFFDSDLSVSQMIEPPKALLSPASQFHLSGTRLSVPLSASLPPDSVARNFGATFCARDRTPSCEQIHGEKER